MALVNYPPKLSLARLPTPLHECRNLADLLRPGQRLWVKRDDETGCLTTGNKVRKLEYYMAEAVTQEADVVLTSGSALSNHCRTTAIVARELGMDVALLLEGPKEPALDGNFLFMVLAGARMRMIPLGTEFDAIDELEDMASRLREEGRTPYIVPPGGTAELGVVAYVEAAEELRSQCDEIDLEPDAVTITVGSCSTYAGLLLGASVGDMGFPVVGLSISGKTDERTEKARRLIDEASALLGLESGVADEDIRIVDDYRGEGYAKAPPDLYAFMADMTRRTGLVLDPVYTGKALWGTIREMQSGCLQDARDVVFVHTGGVFGIYQKKAGFKLDWRTI